MDHFLQMELILQHLAYPQQVEEEDLMPTMATVILVVQEAVVEEATQR